MEVLFIIYLILGYWATNRTIYANKIVFGTRNAIFMQKFLIGMFLGWLLIPIALIKTIFMR